MIDMVEISPRVPNYRRIFLKIINNSGPRLELLDGKIVTEVGRFVRHIFHIKLPIRKIR